MVNFFIKNFILAYKKTNIELHLNILSKRGKVKWRE